MALCRRRLRSRRLGCILGLIFFAYIFIYFVSGTFLTHFLPQERNLFKKSVRVTDVQEVPLYDAENVITTLDVDEELCSGIQWISHPDLPRYLNKSDHEHLLHLLKVLSDSFTKNNITFVMSGRTLLGSYFFHDFLPWDDRAEMLVKRSDMDKVEYLLLEETFSQMYEMQGYIFRKSLLFPKEILSENRAKYYKLRVYRRGTNRWPSIDIKYYAENDTHIWFVDSKMTKFYLKSSNFYPINQRLVHCNYFPVPFNTQEMLKLKYRKFYCYRYKHIDNKDLVRITRTYRTQCINLIGHYPFVLRSFDEDKSLIAETLVFKNKKVYTVWSSDPWDGTVSMVPFEL